MDGETILDTLRNQNDYLIGDSEFISPTKEQTKELGDAVNTAIKSWVAKHNLNLTAWQFAGIRNHECVDIPEVSHE